MIILSKWFRLNFVKNLCLNYYSRNLVLINFRGDNARVFQRVSMNLNMTVGHVACQLLCRYIESTLAVLAESYRLLRVTCGCSCWKCTWSVAQLTSGRGANRPPAKLNVKTGPLPSLYFGVIYYSFGFSRLFFFCVFGVFSGDFVFLHSRSIPDLLLFLNYFLGVSQWVSFS